MLEFWTSDVFALTLQKALTVFEEEVDLKRVASYIELLHRVRLALHDHVTPEVSTWHTEFFREIGTAFLRPYQKHCLFLSEKEKGYMHLCKIQWSCNLRLSTLTHINNTTYSLHAGNMQTYNLELVPMQRREV